MSCLEKERSGTFKTGVVPKQNKIAKRPVFSPGTSVEPYGPATIARLGLTSNDGLRILFGVSDLLWFVAHTRPRREKKLVEFCRRHAIAATLPCYDSAHKYRGKTVVFRKPLFPGYVFLKLEGEQIEAVRRNNHVASLLKVFDQETFHRQLADILLALQTDLGVRLAPSIGEGMRVRIKSGPLEGLEGWVDQRYGMTTVLLRLDFISQAAAVQVEADMLVPV